MSNENDIALHIKNDIALHIRLLTYRRLWFWMYENDMKSARNIYSWLQNNRKQFQIQNINGGIYCIEPYRTLIQADDNKCFQGCELKGCTYSQTTCVKNRLFELFRNGKGNRFASLWFLNRIESLIIQKGWEQGLDELLVKPKMFNDEFAELLGRRLTLEETGIQQVVDLRDDVDLWMNGDNKYKKLTGVARVIFNKVLPEIKTIRVERTVVHNNVNSWVNAALGYEVGIKPMFLNKQEEEINEFAKAGSKLGFYGRKIIRLKDGERKSKA